MEFLPSLLGYGDTGLFILRLVVGLVFLYHALPKISHAKQMAKGMGAPVGLVAVLGLVEVLSALALISGVYLSLGAAALSVIMLGAIFMKMAKWKLPFSSQNATGWEFDLTLLAANIVLLTVGGGGIGLSA